MKNLPIIIFLLMLGWSRSASGQTADHYFHGGAGTYIDGELQNALQTVETGLRAYPDNPRLNALREIIEEALQQQTGQGQDQDDDGQQQDPGDNQPDSERNDPDSGQDGEDDDPFDDNSNELSDESPDLRPDEEGVREEPGPDQISREEAERILQALQRDERELLREVQKPRSERSEGDVTW